MTLQKILDFNETPDKISSQKLAFIGDAVYELLIRNKIICKYNGTIGEINTIKTKNVCCEAQSNLYEKIKDSLTSQELEIFKRGRNLHSGNVPKKASSVVYRRATGIEALFGFLYLNGQYERLLELLENTDI